MNRLAEWLLSCGGGGLIVAGAFALTARPLDSLAVVNVPFWLTAIVIFGTGVLGSLVLVDLKRAFLAAPGIALSGTIFYGLAVWMPATVLPEFSVHLFNYALVQSLPVFAISIVLVTLGTMAGTVINSSVREIDL